MLIINSYNWTYFDFNKHVIICQIRNKEKKGEYIIDNIQADLIINFVVIIISIVNTCILSSKVYFFTLEEAAGEEAKIH